MINGSRTYLLLCSMVLRKRFALIFVTFVLFFCCLMLTKVRSNMYNTPKLYVLLLFVELEVAKLCVNLQINMLADSKRYIILPFILLVWRFSAYFGHFTFVVVIVIYIRWGYYEFFDCIFNVFKSLFSFICILRIFASKTSFSTSCVSMK